ncbi:head maturation protease, ClpP-related [Amycolatopsis sp. NPDC004378]
MARRSRPRAQQRRLQNLRAARAAGAAPRQQPTNWYRMVTNLVDQPDTAAIYIYEEIGYWGVTAQDFVRDLMGLRVSNVIVHINSPGGDVFDGLAIFHALRDHPATIEVRIDGLAASAASFIAMAGDTVVCQRNAQMMIHDASGICIGNAADMQEMVDLLNRCSDNIADIYAARAGGTVAQWRALMQAETWYSGTEAVAAGLADSTAEPGEETNEDTAVVPGEDEEVDELMNRSWDLSIFTYAGRSKAPGPRATATATAATDTEPAAGEPQEAPAAEQAADDTATATDVVDEPADGEPTEDTGTEPADEAPADTAAEATTDSETPADGVTDTWAALTGALYEAAPSTVDELFAALARKGIPA